MAANKTPDVPSTIDLKVPALLAGTATSVVVAVLASRLGAQGTLWGAAFTSLVFGLISPFLTFGLERTHHGLKVVAARRRPSVAEAEPDPAVALEPGRRVRVGAALAAVLATAAVTFAGTMSVVTAFETTTGRSVDGAHKTTVSGVVAPAAPASTPAADGSSLTAERSATPSPAPTVTVTVTPTAPATPATTPAAGDTSAATLTPAPAATQQPTATASPTTTEPAPVG